MIRRQSKAANSGTALHLSSQDRPPYVLSDVIRNCGTNKLRLDTARIWQGCISTDTWLETFDSDGWMKKRKGKEKR